MSLFKDMLKDNESLFTSNVEALDFDYIPKLVPFREQEQKTIATCIKPLFQKRNGKNIFVHGKPGIGKTVAVKHLLKELEEDTDEIFPIFINCWQKNTTYKVILEICDQLGYKFTQNKKTEELAKIVSEIINKNKGAVLVFDEVDKAEDFDFLYTLLETLYRKSIIIITNYKSWVAHLDERIKSRLLPDLLAFREYNEKESIEILKQRRKYAFVEGVWDEDAFLLLAKKATELKDIRTGLYLMREAGQHAEDNSKKKIEVEDAEHSLNALETFSIKHSGELINIERDILAMVKRHSGKKIGELHKLYVDKISNVSYKTFQRKIKKLEDENYISVEKVKGGSEGKTSIINYGSTKKLTDF